MTGESERAIPHADEAKRQREMGDVSGYNRTVCLECGGQVYMDHGKNEVKCPFCGSKAVMEVIEDE